ncbi:MAG: threonylcarbamoyl-AMP synthase [Candidatus Marinimicrobia bacterium]|nr:threonylcarbamoyl-AMP synthase [Candidatus Neomarinimicrobiota bacterium]MBL7010274.1 threonylcarbamoyl-AMP synthase [Candidatus Neomarinimicrobiota bacterium]MBL7030204.1 threonylcarbamoyl-AMP synthase [Candidatus Neomarinimicrobiota bacterium]
MNKKTTDRINASSKHVIEAAGNAILYGGIIVYPTDTLYGFGVDARNETAIKRLNKIKGRTAPISVIAPNSSTVLSWADITYEDWEMVKQYLRGSTTIILPVKKGIVHPSIMGEDGTLGIRIPAHSFGPILCDKLGFPITTTSVNRSGQDPFNNPDEIIAEFDGEFDLLIDDGSLPQSSGSTIYKLEKSKLKVIRS